MISLFETGKTYIALKYIFRFFTIYERGFPEKIFPRIMHILCKENWELMGSYFWISHVINLLLASKSNANFEINFKNYATFASLETDIYKEEIEEINDGIEDQIDESIIEQIEEQSEEPMKEIQEQQPTSLRQKSVEDEMSMRISFNENTQSDVNALSNETSLEKMVEEIENG